jgi:RNA polymerase sigma factor (sigma-70 family)
MHELDDHSLLRQYAEQNSEPAFAAIVSRHVDKVYSAALRHTRNAHAAEEITQAVFVILAKKSGRLGAKVILSGWLYETARLTAVTYIRSEIRRARREQEAYMQTALNEHDDDAWPHIAPLLDDALAGLSAADRYAVVLRYFDGKSLGEVGAAMGASEDAAKKRVNRAVDKLRGWFTKRGVTLTATVLTAAISANSVQAAPLGLAATVTAATAKGTLISGTLTTLVKGTMKTMTWLKIKFGVTASLTALIVGGAVAAATLQSRTDEASITFEVEGTVTYATTPDARGSYSETKHFKATRDGELWKIRTTNVKEEGTGSFAPNEKAIDLYHEMSFDGTNIYRLQQQDEQRALARQPGFKPDVFALGRVEKGDRPANMDGHQLFPIWLAYCSAPYFHKLKGDMAVAARFGARDFLTEASTNVDAAAKWKESGKFFMERIEWYSDGTFEAFWGDGKRTVEKYQPPFGSGFVDGRFEVSAWTNWNGVLIPGSFRLTGYRPDFESGKNPQLVPYYTISAELEQIRAVKDLSAIPELTTKTLISDGRIKNTKGNPSGHLRSYVSTNLWDVSEAIHNPARVPQGARPN